METDFQQFIRLYEWQNERSGFDKRIKSVETRWYIKQRTAECEDAIAECKLMLLEGGPPTYEIMCRVHDNWAFAIQLWRYLCQDIPQLMDYYNYLLEPLDECRRYWGDLYFAWGDIWIKGQIEEDSDQEWMQFQ